MGRKTELKVGGRVGGGGSDFSHRLTRGAGKIEARRCVEMRGGAVSGGVRPERTHPAVRRGCISVADYVGMMASSLWPVYLFRIFYRLTR